MPWIASLKQLTKRQMFSLVTGTVGIIADTVALSLFGASFLGLSPPPAGILAMAVAGVTLLFLWVGCLSVFLAVQLSGVVDDKGRPIVSRSYWHRHALGGMVAIPMIAATLLGCWVWYQSQMPEDIVILVTEIAGPDPERYCVTDAIVAKLQNELSDVEAVQIRRIKETLQETGDSGAARDLATRPFGNRNDAVMVIWGWYGVTPTHVLVNLQVAAPLQGPRTNLLERPGPEAFPVLLWNDYTLQIRLSDEMLYLTSFVAGVAQYTLGNYADAEDSFTIALAQPEPQGGSLGRQIVYYQRGAARFDQGLIEQAIDDYTLALDLDDEYVDAYIDRSVSYSLTGQHENAVADARMAVSLQPDDPVAHNTLGRAYADAGELDNAVLEFRLAIGIDENYAPGHCNLAWAYSLLGEREQAAREDALCRSTLPEFRRRYRGILVVAQ